jgi:hypothetical protein
MLLITILSFGCNLWQCYFWVVFLHNILLTCHQGEDVWCTFIEGKLVYLYGFNGLLIFSNWVYKVIIKLIWNVQFVWLIKVLLNFFVKHSKVILHLMLVLDGTFRSWVGSSTMVSYISLQVFFSAIESPQLVDRALPKLWYHVMHPQISWKTEMQIQMLK